jgi:hypothetical protein
MDIDIRALQKMSAVPDEVLIELGRITALPSTTGLTGVPM